MRPSESPSFEKRITMILLVVMLLPTSLVAWIAFVQLEQTMKADRIRTVGRVADTRHMQLTQVFEKAIGRSEAFLADVYNRCGPAAVVNACGRQALQTFLASENAIGVMLLDHGTHHVAGDTAVAPDQVPPFKPEQLAHFPERKPGAERIYLTVAHNPYGGMRLVTTYPVRNLQPIFVEHRDLGKSGENFLADRDGFFVTNARYPSEQGHRHPISAMPMKRCLTPESAETVDLDYRDAPIIHGFRFITETGGGCIMAHIDQAEAFAPLQTLKNSFFVVLLLFTGLAVMVARYLGRKISQPLNQLTGEVQRLEAGASDLGEIPASYREVDKLLRAFRAMHARLMEQTESLNLMSKAFTHAGEGCMITDAENRIVMVNDSFVSLTGYALEDVIGKNPRMLAAGGTLPEVFEDMWQSITQRSRWQGELWDRRKTGETYPVRLAISVVYKAAGSVVNHIGSFSDISEQKKSEERIRHIAYRDSLTGLLNRYSLFERLNQTLGLASTSQLAVMLIDLDNFKSINDTLGHPAGDQLLVQVAQRLGTVVRQNDLVARLGGDEFVVVLLDIESSADVAHVAGKLLTLISEPCQIDGQEVRTSPSIGICLYPDDATQGRDLIKKADLAMYQAKASGRSRYYFFSEEMLLAAVKQRTIEADIYTALERRQFVLHYQPQMDLHSGQIVGVEALVRWQHPERGLIQPLEFIPIAEESGLILPLGDWILEEACRQLAEWQASGIQHITMAVNLSANQFFDQSLPMRIEKIVTQAGLKNENLVLEVTESLAMTSPDSAIAMMKELNRLGHSIALDDFGTGDSSLAYHEQFPVRVLKIDRSFVEDIETDSNAADICDMIVRLARKLGLEVVAEGVETQAQRTFLAGIGCDKIQGCSLSKPLPPDLAKSFIEGHTLAARDRVRSADFDPRTLDWTPTWTSNRGNTCV